MDSNGCWRGLKMEMEKGHFYNYNPNGGIGCIEKQECECGSDGVQVDDGGNFHWEGHCFVGWAFAPDGECLGYGGGWYDRQVVAASIG